MSNRLMSSLRDISRYHIRLRSAHTILTQACLGLFLYSDDHVTPESVLCFPLGRYAAIHWFEHAHFEDVASCVKDGIETLFDLDKPHFAVWADMYDNTQFPWAVLGDSQMRNPLYYSVICGIDGLIEHLAFKHPHFITAVGGESQNPLLGALVHNRLKAAEFLLEHGADVDARGVNSRTILLIVISDSERYSRRFNYDNVPNMVKLLLKHGADVNARDNSLTSPLHFMGNCQLEVARILLKHKADVNAHDKNGKTPLHELLGNREWYQEQVSNDHVRLLLEYGADVNRRDKNNDTPLHLAILWNHFKIAIILLENGADANAKNHKNLTPLHILSEHWTRLMRRGTRVNSIDIPPQTTRQDLLELARTLLERGADANSENSFGMTLLQILTESEFDEVDDHNFARLLLEHGAEANRLDVNNDTLLHLAIRWDQLKVAEILLVHGADPNATGNIGETPLHILTGCWVDGQREALNLTRFMSPARDDAHSEAKIPGEDGSTLLRPVSRWDSFSLAGTLVEICADLTMELESHAGVALLHRQSEKAISDKFLLRAQDFAQLFLEHGAEVNKLNPFNETPLHIAIRWKQFKLAEFLLKHGADSNAEDAIGSTPMHVLSVAEIENENKDNVLYFARVLLEHGAEVNRQDEDDQTPLHIAIQCDQCKLAKILVEHGADPNAVDNNGSTPLHKLSEFEIENEDDVLDLARLLIKHGAEVNRRDKRKRTPLHAAIRWDMLRLARILVENGADTNAENYHGMTSLHFLATSKVKDQGDILDLAMLLLKHGAEVNRRNKVNEIPLHLAIRRDQFKFAGILLEHGTDANLENNNGETPLRILSESRTYDEGDFTNHARLLLSKNGVGVARGDGEKKALLLRGIGKGKHTFIEIIIDLNADAQSNVSPFQISALLLFHGATLNTRQKNGGEPESSLCTEVEGEYYIQSYRVSTQQSVAHIPDVNVQDENDLTPLHLASFYGWVEMVRALLDHGANVHSEDRLDRTPLHLVAKGTGRDIGHGDSDDIGVAKVLLEHGADSNAQDKHQNTPLHLALYYGNVEIVRVLLDHGANASAKDARGLTALHMVSSDTYLQDGVGVAQLLLEHGADVNAEDHDHAIPSDFALRHRRPEIASFLLHHRTGRWIGPSPGLENWHCTDCSFGVVVPGPLVSKCSCLPG